MLPSEPKPTDIEDLNEADLFFFGKAPEQKSQVTGWLGTKSALGLLRSDGSVIVLGIGREPATFQLPDETVRQAKQSFRVFDLGRPRYQNLTIANGAVEVRPGWVTVVDRGSSLQGPQ
jgi:hypothetical protein